MHNLPSPFKTACEDRHLAGFKKYTKSACLLKCRADYVIGMCKCRSYDLEGKSLARNKSHVINEPSVLNSLAMREKIIHD